MNSRNNGTSLHMDREIKGQSDNEQKKIKEGTVCT